MMRFLCFHGATSNSAQFKNVLCESTKPASLMRTKRRDFILTDGAHRQDHLRKNLEADDTASFHFIDGVYEAQIMPDIRYECAPPNLHWLDHRIVDVDHEFQKFAENLTHKNMVSPEDGARKLWDSTMGRERSVADLTLEYVRNVIEDEGPFDGVIGASEGGGAAATVLFDQLELARESGRPCAMQCGIFFVSMPVVQRDGKTLLLCDETDDRIPVPTCHILSETDGLGWLSKGCANACQDRGKTFVLHEGGHTIPHTEELMVDVAEVVHRVKKGLTDEPVEIVRNAATT